MVGDINLSSSKIGEVIVKGSEEKPLKFGNMLLYGAEISGLYVTSSEFQKISTAPPTFHGETNERAERISKGLESFDVSPELIRVDEIKMLKESKASVDALWIIACRGKELFLNGLQCSNLLIAESSLGEIWMDFSELGQIVLKGVKVGEDFHLKFSKIETGKLLQPVEIGGRLYPNHAKISSNRFAVELFKLARQLFKREELLEDLDNAEYCFYRGMVARRKWRVELARDEAKIVGGLRGRLKVLTAQIGSLAEYLFLDITTKYGTSWKRLVSIWLPMVLLIFPALYYFTNSVPGIESYWKAVYFSVVTATTLGYGDYHPVGIGTLIASLEAILGTFMWALLITVLGRKYLNP
ncbi:potassium channel family protein [Thermococcus prieurii]